jgi:hypothetical protein
MMLPESDQRELDEAHPEPGQSSPRSSAKNLEVLPMEWHGSASLSSHSICNEF